MPNLTIDSINIDVKGHTEAVKGSAFWTFAAKEWHRLYRPYVPYKEGVLYDQVHITGGNGEGTIEHTAPYAHYAYEGVVYGPNVPITQGGAIVGWYSPESPKRPTGAMLHYSGMGSRHWDEAAKPTQLPQLVATLDAYIKRMI